MNRQRLQIRFCKQGDLRLISHRDLARVWERLFRRTQLPLAMSEGFHPHPKITFPLALALGVEGIDEVVEVTAIGQHDPEPLREQLRQLSPPGLNILSVTIVAQGSPKPHAERVVYRLPVPSSRHRELTANVEKLMKMPHHYIQREGRKKPLDLRAAIEQLRLDNGTLIIQLKVLAEAMARPREILETLGLPDVEQDGVWLTRTEVNLASTTP